MQRLGYLIFKAQLSVFKSLYCRFPVDLNTTLLSQFDHRNVFFFMVNEDRAHHTNTNMRN